MGQSMPIEEGHEGGGKRGQSLIKCQQGRFCTDRLSKEHHHKINHLIRAESRACKTDPFLDGLEKTRCREEVCDYRHREQTSREEREPMLMQFECLTSVSVFVSSPQD